MSLQPGQVLKDRYEIVAFLNEGGMGSVYKARDTLAEGSLMLAVKELKITDFVEADDRTLPNMVDFTFPGLDGTFARLDDFDENDDETRLLAEEITPRPYSQPRSTSRQTIAESQFKAEARILHFLNHPNLPKVHDYFREDDDLYLVMDLIEGRDLDQVLKEDGHNGLQGEQVLGWISQVMDALRYCHMKGVIHQDIKPENIILTEKGRVFLVDFGIAGRKVGDDIQGVRGGTDGYCPPEQYESGIIDTRSDIYALGATLYKLVTGITPQKGSERTIHDEVISPIQISPKLSQVVDACIRKALSLAPEDRYTSILEFQQAIGLIPEDYRPPSVFEVYPGDDLAGIARTAGKGAVIRLHGGRYQIKDTLVVNRDLNLEAADDIRPVVVCKRSVWVASFSGGSWKITGIDFIHEGDYPADVVVVEGKNIEIEDCTFSGGIADPKKPMGSGLVLRGSTNGWVKKSTSRKNGRCGIEVKGNCIVHIIDNLCTENQHNGIIYNEKSSGYVGGNKCLFNGYPGLAIQGAARVDAEGNICEENRYSGLTDSSIGAVSILNNICSRNETNGITISGNAAPKVEHNTCELNKEFGILFVENAKGQVSKNVCRLNHKSGIGVKGKADPDLNRNLCEQNRECGLYLTDRGVGNLWKNECRKNRSHGIEITGSAAPYLNANQFIENGEHGISVGKAAMPVQVNNTSKGNGRGDSIHYQSN